MITQVDMRHVEGNWDKVDDLRKMTQYVDFNSVCRDVEVHYDKEREQSYIINLYV